jgi:hypothetical protein
MPSRVTSARQRGLAALFHLTPTGVFLSNYPCPLGLEFLRNLLVESLFCLMTPSGQGLQLRVWQFLPPIERARIQGTFIRPL